MSTSDPPYRFEDAQGYSVIVVQPRLNDSQWSEFENVGNELLGRLNQAKSSACLVDLSGLNYMGSAMVALIVRLWKSVKERNGKMVVINQHPMVYEVMKLAGLHNVWTIVESRDQGLKQLGKRSGESSDGSAALLILGAVGVVAGVVGLGLLLKFIPVDLSPKIAMACTLGGAAVGLFAGTVCAAKGTGSKQKAGIAFAIASAAILIAGILNMPSGQAGAAANNSANPAANNVAAGETSTVDASEVKVSLPANSGKRKKEDEKTEPAATETAADPAATPDQPASPETNAEEAGAPADPAADTTDAATPEIEAKKKALPGFKGFKKSK